MIFFNSAIFFIWAFDMFVLTCDHKYIIECMIIKLVLYKSFNSIQNGIWYVHADSEIDTVVLVFMCQIGNTDMGLNRTRERF